MITAKQLSYQKVIWLKHRLRFFFDSVQWEHDVPHLKGTRLFGALAQTIIMHLDFFPSHQDSQFSMLTCPSLYWRNPVCCNTFLPRRAPAELQRRGCVLFIVVLANQTKTKIMSSYKLSAVTILRRRSNSLREPWERTPHVEFQHSGLLSCQVKKPFVSLDSPGTLGENTFPYIDDILHIRRVYDFWWTHSLVIHFSRSWESNAKSERKREREKERKKK